MAPSLPDITVRCGAQGVAQGDTDMLHHRVVAIAIDHACRAAVAHALGSVEVPNVAQGSVPVVAAPNLQVPIQIEIFPSGKAPEHFRLAAQVTLHVLDRRHRVLHGEPNAVAPQDVAGLSCIGERHPPSRRDRQSVVGETAKGTARIAGVGDGEVTDPRATLPQRLSRYLPNGTSRRGSRGHRTVTVSGPVAPVNPLGPGSSFTPSPWGEILDDTAPGRRRDHALGGAGNRSLTIPRHSSTPSTPQGLVDDPLWHRLAPGGRCPRVRGLPAPGRCRSVLVLPTLCIRRRRCRRGANGIAAWTMSSWRRPTTTS